LLTLTINGVSFLSYLLSSNISFKELVSL